MAAMQCACPKCQQVLQVTQALPARVECPRCRTRFIAGDTPRKDKKDKASLIKKDRDAVRGAAAGNGASGAAPIQTMRPMAPAPAPAPSPLVMPTIARRGQDAGRGWGLLLALLLVLLLVGGVIMVLALTRDKKKPLEPEIEPRAELPVVAGRPMSERDRKIDSAVNKGVEYLRNEILNGSGKDYYAANTDPRAGSPVGVLALGGLTLLECGLPSTDAAVEKVIKIVKAEAPRLEFTYSLALSILFLDKLDQASDRPPDPSNVDLIQRLAVRMMAAQNATGGWGYNCPVLTPAQYDKHLADLKANTFRPGSGGSGYDDNSINQFASLALWAARKHGIRTEPALGMLEGRYRKNQNEDGSWGYRARDNGSLKDATTCAGLIGLAVGQGIRDVPAGKDQTRVGVDPTKDPYIAKGLAYIARGIGKDPRRMNPRDRDLRIKHTKDMMALNKQYQEAPENEKAGIEKRIAELDNAKWLKGTYFNSDSWGDLYFLWSVERVGVIFDLQKIGGKDWYDWGVDIILANQQPDGSWARPLPRHSRHLFRAIVPAAHQHCQGPDGQVPHGGGRAGHRRRTRTQRPDPNNRRGGKQRGRTCSRDAPAERVTPARSAGASRLHGLRSKAGAAASRTGRVCRGACSARAGLS